jgi:hypothetical protein
MLRALDSEQLKRIDSTPPRSLTAEEDRRQQALLDPYSVINVRQLADAYLSALSAHNAQNVLACFSGGSSVPQFGGATGSNRDYPPGVASPEPVLRCASVRRRWGVPDGALSGRAALLKHFTKGFEPVATATANSSAYHNQEEDRQHLFRRNASLQRPASFSQANTLLSGDDADARAEFVALLPGATRSSWMLLYRRLDRDDVSASDNRSSLVSESWELDMQGRIVIATVFAANGSAFE